MKSMVIIEELRLARLARRMTQKDVAQQVGVTNLTFCKWETGATSPTLEKLMDWSNLFDLEVSLTKK